MDSGQLKTFEGATEFFPGFRAEPAYGHTAGLTVYILENDGEKVMFWATSSTSLCRWTIRTFLFASIPTPRPPLQREESFLRMQPERAILSRPTTCLFRDLGISGKTATPIAGCRLTM